MDEIELIGPVRVHGKYGFLNKKGEFIIQPRFEAVGPFKEGLAWYREKDRFGFIDPVGNIIITAKFESSLMTGPYFSSGLAAIGPSGRMGYIDKSGNYPFTTVFVRCGDYVGNLAMVLGFPPDQEFMIINREGGMLTQLSSVYEIPEQIGYDPKWSWDFFLCHFFINDRILVGGINWKGDILFTPQFPWVTNFWSDVAGFCEHEDNSQNLFGLINKEGKIIHSPKFHRMGNFSEGLAGAGYSLRDFGFINTDGEWVIEPRFEDVRPFSEGLACVTMRGKKGFVNLKGELAIPPEFHREARFCNGIAEVEYKDKRAFIDKSGRVIWEIPLVEE